MSQQSLSVFCLSSFVCLSPIKAQEWRTPTSEAQGGGGGPGGLNQALCFLHGEELPWPPAPSPQAVACHLSPFDTETDTRGAFLGVLPSELSSLSNTKGDDAPCQPPV